MRIGIYGGTFSPPHKGHIEAARAFMRQMWLDILYVIPAGIPPHKDADSGAEAIDRYEMCKAAFSGIDGVIVSDLEIKRTGKSYTVDTLEYFSEPDSRLFLLMGTDMMLTLDEWHCPERIFELSYPVYVRREGGKELDDLIVKKIAEYNAKYGKVVRRIVTDPIEISSSEIRDAVRQGKDVDSFLSPDVIKYIKENKLYQ